MSEAEREELDRKSVPGKRLGPADRVAYYQIATTSGVLRARASTILSGFSGTPRATLEQGRARLDRVRPTSQALQGLQKELGAAIDRMLAHESRPSARAAMRATSAINADLVRFSKGKAVRLLLPD